MSIYERFEKYADKTFNDAAERYIAEFQGKCVERVLASIESVWSYIGTMRLIDIDDEALAQFKHDRMNGGGRFKRKAMVGTANKDLTQIITILNRACRIWRWLPSTPQFVRIEGETRSPYPLTWLEQDKLFRCLPTGWDVGAAIFAINTGVRKSELFGLTWADEVKVPELDGFVFILNRTKNGERRAVVCNSIARRAVDTQRAYQAKHGQSEYVFPSRANGHEGNKVRSAGKVFDNAWKMAGLPNHKLCKRGLHNLRHSFGHRLRSAGVSQENRNALLGHARTNLAEHYALPDLRKLFDAAELITQRTDTVVLRGVWEDKARPT